MDQGDPWLGLNYFFVDKEFDAQCRDAEQTLLLITFFIGVATVISCSGIFALSAISARQHTKETDICKVLGASVTSIVTRLSRDFLTSGHCHGARCAVGLDWNDRMAHSFLHIHSTSIGGYSYWQVALLNDGI